MKFLSWGGVLRVLLTVALASIGAGALSCRPRIERPEDVIGRYVLNLPTDRDVIEVRPDGRYVRSFTQSDGRAVVDSGSWKLEFHAGPRVMFEGFRPRPRPEQKVGQGIQVGAEALWPALVERTLSGEVRLVVDIDLGTAYIRDDQQN